MSRRLIVVPQAECPHCHGSGEVRGIDGYLGDCYHRVAVDDEPTPDPALDALAYGLYAAFQRGAGRFATDAPYPVRAWSKLPDQHRARYRLRAERFRQTAHLPLPIRCFTAYHVGMNVTPWDRLGPGLRALWETVALEWAALDAERRAA